MTNTDDIAAQELRRIPGLFRRWELPEVLAPDRCYRIEDAGSHADGTPLLALFTLADAPSSGGRETPSNDG